MATGMEGDARSAEMWLQRKGGGTGGSDGGGGKNSQSLGGTDFYPRTIRRDAIDKFDNKKTAFGDDAFLFGSPETNDNSGNISGLRLSNGYGHSSRSYNHHGTEKMQTSSHMNTISGDHLFVAGNAKLYEAYNDLHGLAHDFRKPFDAPAILVVGHQTDGKSALIEALMGFQFNHVGGGTKTRRPITLHMKFNIACEEPLCFLVNDDKYEEEKTLEEIQEYIERENRRLEKSSEAFWAREIVVKIEYKYCPNLTIIDTPGLIAAAPGKRNSSLQHQARQVESLVRAKMEQREYIMLCLEDSSDWSNATTRSLVMKVDPDLSRTVMVSTKFDTRIPQFSRSADIELFMRPHPRVLETSILGGSPFFTSVPAGRVGGSRDSIFSSNEEFRDAVYERELNDVDELEKRLDRLLEPNERARVGVSQLRRFLEQLLQRRYMESVPSIVPLLEQEHRSASTKLKETSRELGSLDVPRLKERGRAFRESFIQSLLTLLRGTCEAPPERFGETLNDERIRGGEFKIELVDDGDRAISPLTSAEAALIGIPNSHMRLYGGAQYNRALAEFRKVLANIKCPDVNRELIANATGVNEMHDGADVVRTACIIAVAKAKEIFHPFLQQLGRRLTHILRKAPSIIMHMLKRSGSFLCGHEKFLKRVTGAYHKFIDEREEACQSRTSEDLDSTTRFVTWSLHHRDSGNIRKFLEEQSRTRLSRSDGTSSTNLSPKSRDTKERGEEPTELDRLVELLETTLWSRTLGPVTEEIIGVLVGAIFEGIKSHFIANVELKFNCFLLLPIIDEFPSRLREEIEGAFESAIEDIFDVASARASLLNRQRELEAELQRVEALKGKFNHIHQQISQKSMEIKKHPRQPSAQTKQAKQLDGNRRMPLVQKQI